MLGWWLFFDGIGTAGEWVAGVGALAAAVVALRAGGRQRRYRLEDSLRRSKLNAGLLNVRHHTTSTTTETGRRWQYELNNRHVEPFTDIVVHARAEGETLEGDYYDVLRPTNTRRAGIKHVASTGQPSRHIEYSDVDGNRWRQDDDGVVELVRTSCPRRRLRRGRVNHPVV